MYGLQENIIFHLFPVASLLVSIGEHQLSNGSKVEISFPGCKETDSDDDAEESDSEAQPGLLYLRMHINRLFHMDNNQGDIKLLYTVKNTDSPGIFS